MTNGSKIKRIILVLAAVIMTLPAMADVKIYTRKARLADFQEKTMKVVQCGDPLLDAVLRDEVSSSWMLSPYEFCTLDDFARLKTSANYYFLSYVKEDGILYLRLEKGGNEKDPDTFRLPMEILTLPVASSDQPSEHNLLYMEAYVQAMQRFTTEAMTSDGKAYSGPAWFNIANFNGKEATTDPVEGDKYYKAGEADTLVGVLVAPSDAHEGGWCYKMMIAADTRELVYFRRHKISRKDGVEFLRSDLKRIYGASAGQIH